MMEEADYIINNTLMVVLTYSANYEGTRAGYWSMV